jgi:hypothetical protein
MLIDWRNPNAGYGQRHGPTLLNRGCHFKVAAKGIGKLDLPWRFAFHLKQSRTRDDYSNTLCSGDSNVQPIQTVKELHTSGSVFGSRSRHRVKDDGGLLSLKFIDCTYTSTRWKGFSQSGNLRVVRRNDQNIFQRYRGLLPCFVCPSRSSGKQTIDKFLDLSYLFGGFILASTVLDSNVPQANGFAIRRKTGEKSFTLDGDH